MTDSLNEMRENFSVKGVTPASSSMTAVIEWNEEQRCYELRYDFYSHEADKRAGTVQFEQTLKDLKGIDMYDITAASEEHKKCRKCMFISCAITFPFFICWAMGIREKRDKYVNKCQQRVTDIQNSLDKANEEIYEALSLNLWVDKWGYFINVECCESPQKAKEMRTERIRIKKEEEEKADQEKVARLAANNNSSNGRCNTWFGGSDKFRANFCNSCGYGNKVDNCCVCDEWLGTNKTPAFLCNSCGFGNKKDNCVKCNNWCGSTKIPAFLCHTCSFGNKKDHCAKR